MTNQTECQRCEGKGHIRAFNHIKGGVCVKCNGTGTVKVSIKRNRKPTRKQELAKIRQAQYTIVRQRYTERIMEDNRVWESPRMTVDKNHPYAEMHAIEVFEWHQQRGW